VKGLDGARRSATPRAEVLSRLYAVDHAMLAQGMVLYD